MVHLESPTAMQLGGAVRSLCEIAVRGAARDVIQLCSEKNEKKEADDIYICNYM